MKINISTRANEANRKTITSPAGFTLGFKGQRSAVFQLPAGCKSARGLTLPEVMVAMAVGSLILMVMAMTFLTSARSFAAMGDYVSMDVKARNALDRMTREIRQAGGLAEFTSTRLTFYRLGDTNSFLVYNWDAGSRQLTSWSTGDDAPIPLLTDCDQLTFSMYDILFAPTTNISEGKGIRVVWKCSRTNPSNRTTTEDMQQGLIVMRNKPL